MSTPARRALASAVLATTVTAGLVATGGVASAADLRVSDPVGDPVRFSFVDGEDDVTATPAPGARSTDVTSVRFDLRNRFLVVVGQAESAGGATTAFVRVKNGGRDIYFHSTRKGGVRADSGKDCAGGTSSFDAEAATYRLRIPTSCFGTPEKARLGFALLRGATASAPSFTVDVAGKVGYDDNDDIKLSEAVARG